MVLFNGNDAMALYKGNQLLDVIGQIGENPGEEWSIGSFGTENGTLVRNPDILKGQTDWSEGIEDWSSYPENEFQFLGSHNNNTCTSNSSFQCQELFFSEYIEGSGNHTALEIFNPTNDSIDLEAYTIERYNNGSTSPSYVENLSGSLAPLSTFVLVNPGADVELTGLANLFSEATIYSGNDAISLSKDGSAIDIIGVIGDNPGTFWEVDNGGTLDHTLVRKFEINQGELNWEVGANQWEVFPLDTYNQLGSHSNICGSSNPQFSFLNETIFVEEDEEEYLIGFTFTGLDAQEEEIFLIFTGGTAEIGNDFVFMDTTLVINENTETPFYIPVSLIDDNEEEEMESIIFTIASASGNIDIVTSEFTLNIQDDDTPLPYLQISAVKGIDSLGISTELGTLCELRGVVYGGNLEANGKRQFTIIDPTGGISVYDGGNPNITYEVTEGDSIHIEGDITQFQGLTQIHPSQITLISQDNPVKEPLVVETLGEDTESNLVKLECATLVSPEAWTPGSGTGFSATAYNATDIFIIRIDDQVDLFNTNAPPEWFTIIGISSQFATSSQAPYLDGYQIVPRNFQDVLPCGEVGIETQPIEQLSVKLYPNPSKDWIQIETQNPFGELLVFDLNGRLVLSDRILENNRFTLDIASLNTGLYILHLNGKTGSQTVRFEKN